MRSHGEVPAFHIVPDGCFIDDLTTAVPDLPEECHVKSMIAFPKREVYYTDRILPRT